MTVRPRTQGVVPIVVRQVDGAPLGPEQHSVHEELRRRACGVLEDLLDGCGTPRNKCPSKRALNKAELP